MRLFLLQLLKRITFLRCVAEQSAGHISESKMNSKPGIFSCEPVSHGVSHAASTTEIVVTSSAVVRTGLVVERLQLL